MNVFWGITVLSQPLSFLFPTNLVALGANELSGCVGVVGSRYGGGTGGAVLAVFLKK